jgi:hypothetical protein
LVNSGFFTLILICPSRFRQWYIVWNTLFLSNFSFVQNTNMAVLSLKTKVQTRTLGLVNTNAFGFLGHADQLKDRRIRKASILLLSSPTASSVVSDNSHVKEVILLEQSEYVHLFSQS